MSNPEQWNRYVYVLNSPLASTDPSGEILELTGSPEEQRRSLERLRGLLGKEADIGIITLNNHVYVQARGDLRDAAGNVGGVIQDIITSQTTTVEFQVTNKDHVNDASREDINLGERLAVTQIISKTRIQIFIKDGSADTVTFKARKEWAEDWGSLKFTDSVIDAHEFGHAWGAIVDHTYEKSLIFSNKHLPRDKVPADPIMENNNRSLQVENWQRDRLGLSHRTSHP